MFSRILVPMDFSAPSDAALDYARGVAMRFDASLHLLHVADDPYPALYSGDVFVPEVEPTAPPDRQQRHWRAEGMPHRVGRHRLRGHG